MRILKNWGKLTHTNSLVHMQIIKNFFITRSICHKVTGKIKNRKKIRLGVSEAPGAVLEATWAVLKTFWNIFDWPRGVLGGSCGAPGTASRGLGRLLDRLGGQYRQRATGARFFKPSWVRFGLDFRWVLEVITNTFTYNGDTCTMHKT